MSQSGKRRLRRIALVSLALLVAIQFVPVERVNEMGAGDPIVPREVMWTLRRACYDCHSNETRWPVWAYVAPMSWLSVSDVSRARAVLNFSEWQGLDLAERIALRSLVNPVTASHRMPLWYYLPLHPDASLSEAELARLEVWSKNVDEEKTLYPFEAAPLPVATP